MTQLPHRAYRQRDVLEVLKSMPAGATVKQIYDSLVEKGIAPKTDVTIRYALHRLETTGLVKRKKSAYREVTRTKSRFADLWKATKT